MPPKLDSFTDHWAPRVVASMNGYDVRVVRVEGGFVWHSHPDADDLFLVPDDELDIELRDGVVTLGPGELYAVPDRVHADEAVCSIHSGLPAVPPRVRVGHRLPAQISTTCGEAFGEAGCVGRKMRPRLLVVAPLITRSARSAEMPPVIQRLKARR